MSDKYVLLVEDNEDDELLAVRAFKRSGINKKLIVVRDGLEAVEFIFCTGKYTNRDIYHQPEFILLDLKLPKLDGHQVLEKIRAREETKFLPVIILTSSQQEHDLHHSYLKGANSYVIKPLDPTDFLTLIQHVGQYWLEHNKIPSSSKIGPV